MRAISKLCSGEHKNIVEVFQLGEFDDLSYFFIDMELCDMNLDNYNKSGWTMSVIAEDNSAGFREMEMWHIMAQIASGISYIHGKGEVHRDLKPLNGQSLLNYRVCIMYLLTTSPLFSKA